jgi:Ca2+-binding RTX toxin-like protein
MNKKGFLMTVTGLFLLVFVSLISASAAANTVPTTKAESQVVQSEITANNLKPPECMMNLTNLVICTAGLACNGTEGNDLVLGNASDESGAKKLNGKDGDDCLLSGAGKDEVRGGDGDDVLFGGAGNDTLRGQNDTDVCFGETGKDSYDNCETEIDG